MPEIDLELARLQADAFRNRFGASTFALACHAAFPLALTPDLVTHLWQTFDRDIYGRPLNIPWVAIADLLLSDLCAEVGNEVYEMKTPVRRVLLDALKSDANLGEMRLGELSEFLQEYIRDELGSADVYTRNFAETQKWTALATAHPEQAATQVAQAVKESIQGGNIGEQLRLAAVADTLSDELKTYQQLLDYLSARRDLLQGTRKPHPGTLGPADKPTLVLGVELPPLDAQLPPPVERQIGPPPQIPPYIFGINGLGGETELLAAGKPGWVVDLQTADAPTSLVNFAPRVSQGLGVIVVLVNGFGGDGTIPTPDGYDAFAGRCAEVVRRSTGARIWIIGNEPNTPARRPGGAPITPELYARGFNACRRAIRSVPNHENDWVIPAAVAPFNTQTPYAGNPSGDWVQYLSDMLKQIQAQGGGLDGIALHVYSRAQTPDSITDATTSPPPFERNHYGFLAYRDFLAAVPDAMRALPVLITETMPMQFGVPHWANQDSGWVQAAYAEIDAWNQSADHQPIQALCLNEWTLVGASPTDWTIADKTSVLQDLQAALKNEYRVRMPSAPPNVATAAPAAPDASAPPPPASASTLPTLAFDLAIERLDGAYRARVINSPAGQASYEFKLPFSDSETQDVLFRVGRAPRAPQPGGSPEMRAARDWGARLFEAVFGSGLDSIARTSLRKANEQKADGSLALRLHLGDAPELERLPWEFLYDREQNGYVALNSRTPLVRFLELPGDVRPPAIAPPLRILVLLANPRDYPPIDVEREWSRLNDALGELPRQGRVELERLEQPTIVGLRGELSKRQYHILHLIAPSVANAKSDDELLILEDPERRARTVSGELIGTLLADHPALRLVVVNPAEGATATPPPPIARLANILVRRGIPAVIATQFQMSDAGTLMLARELYAGLARGYSVDRALTEARSSIFADGGDVEWAAPVLYSRVPDGVLFEVTSPPVTAASVQQSASTTPESPQRAAFPRSGKLQVEIENRKDNDPLQVGQTYTVAVSFDWADPDQTAPNSPSGLVDPTSLSATVQLVGDDVEIYTEPQRVRLPTRGRMRPVRFDIVAQRPGQVAVTALIRLEDYVLQSKTSILNVVAPSPAA